ncbi:hypothetical protein EW146_g10449 [Bondarzewia mesenterica]|uniref:Uncharacterized protein n=1 Tax=Bondarzewia mesenterica TaxID=1095465 RepID=A0A4S4KYW3_9AGAM|nr:hypothetical protein EW146_g10449 [Bondarzewia mesenterica]
MVSCAYYFGPVGITGGRVEDPSKPRMHTFDTFLAVEELGESDINALLYVYVPSQDAVPDDGTYFICARFGVFAIQTGGVDVVGDSNHSDSRTTSSGVHILQLFVSNTMKPLHGHGQFAGYAISCGKAERTPPDVMEERGFDMSLSQWMGTGNRDVHLRVFISNIPKLSKTRVPTANTNLSIVGHIVGIRERRCVLRIFDIGLGSAAHQEIYM